MHSSLHIGLEGLLQNRGAPLRKTSVSGSAKSSWLGELENVSVGLGVSLFSGEVEASNTPRYASLFPHTVTNFRALLLVGRLAHK